jgi:hypothetical protein
MPKFEDPKEPVSVDIDGDTFTIMIDKHKPIRLTKLLALALANQIGYAVEYVEFYDPR